MAKLNTEFSVKLDSSFNKMIELQSLITEREGLSSENTKRITEGLKPLYGNEYFQSIAMRMRELKIPEEQAIKSICGMCGADVPHTDSTYLCSYCGSNLEKVGRLSK